MNCRDAVVEAVKNGLLIITGDYGTGKTTTINAIIQYFEMEGMDIFLAAPTGRGSKTNDGDNRLSGIYDSPTSGTVGNDGRFICSSTFLNETRRIRWRQM